MNQNIINLKEIIDRIKGSADKAQFVSFTYRNKKADELARHTLILGASYITKVKESLLALELLEPTFVSALEKEAAQALKESFQKTIESFAKGEYNPKYTKPHAYVTITNGLKYCLSTGIINVSGLAHTKVILEPGVYPKVNHSLLVEQKNLIKENLPISKWREFCLNLENLKSARLQGTELVLE